MEKSQNQAMQDEAMRIAKAAREWCFKWGVPYLSVSGMVLFNSDGRKFAAATASSIPQTDTYFSVSDHLYVDDPRVEKILTHDDYRKAHKHRNPEICDLQNE